MARWSGGASAKARNTEKESGRKLLGKNLRLVQRAQLAASAKQAGGVNGKRRNESSAENGNYERSDNENQVKRKNGRGHIETDKRQRVGEQVPWSITHPENPEAISGREGVEGDLCHGTGQCSRDSQVSKVETVQAVDETWDTWQAKRTTCDGDRCRGKDTCITLIKHMLLKETREEDVPSTGYAFESG